MTSQTLREARKYEETFEKNIKAEGQSMREEKPGAADVFSEEDGKRLLQEAQIAGGRASIETFLHAITGKYTLHSHPTLVNVLTARKDGEEILQQLFQFRNISADNFPNKQKIHALIVVYDAVA